ncbi:MAG: GTPase Era [Pseudomonadota bacterium]
MVNDVTSINRAGFTAIIGAPNAGKSTLVNRLVGTKVAIVTHKVQTTRFPVRGIAHFSDAQIVLLDTPGIFSARSRLDRAMVQSAWAGADDADCRVHLVDASAWISDKPTPAQIKSMEDDRSVTGTLKAQGKSAILALNKIDLFDHAQVLALIAEFNKAEVYSDIVPISAENGDGVDRLLELVAAQMPEGPQLYPANQAADLPLRLIAAEITRERLMLRLHQELPYQLTVETESWEDRADGSVRIQQVIIVGRESHKSMVLGKGGRVTREIGQGAREELKDLLGQTVHLFLFVKVDERWQEKRERYEGLGLDFDVG